MIRIAAALAAALFALFLVLVLLAPTHDRDVMVPIARTLEPSGRAAGATAAAAPAPELQAALRQRTELQRWRAESGPASEEAVVEALNGRAPVDDKALPSSEALVESWLAAGQEESDILRAEDFTEGAVNLPYETAEVLMQPQGRDFRRLHNEEVTYGGGYAIFGISLLLALFLLFRGRIRIKEGFSGITLPRFGALERANHWITASSFILMALSGLVILYGQFLIRPLVGPLAYSSVAEYSAYLHIAFAVPFVIGVTIMIVIWIGQNLIKGLDLHWLAKGGGMISEDQDPPPAEKFNAGQKLIFWGVVLGTLALLASGLSLVMPFFWLDIAGMQWAQVGHAAIGLLMIALIIAHIYIGTIGMQGAFDAMWSGRVDRNWAKEHHSIWYRKLVGSDEERRQAPAE